MQPGSHLKTVRGAGEDRVTLANQEFHSMKILSCVLLALSAALLSACDADDAAQVKVDMRDGDGDGDAGGGVFDRGDGAIGMDGDKVVIEAGGTRAKAVIGPDGSLTIGNAVIDTGAAGQAALKAYDAAAVAMKTHAIAIGHTGAAFGVDVLKDVVSGFFDEKRMDQVGERAGEGAQSLIASLRELCTRMETVLAAQQAAAAAVPAFQPYAVLEADQVRECREGVDEEANDAGDSPPPAAPEAPDAT